MVYACNANIAFINKENDMAEIIKPEPSLEELLEWDKLKRQIADFKPTIDLEMAMRKRIAKSFFHEPKEGANKYPLHEGWVLEFTNNIDRKFDLPALTAGKAMLLENKIPVDALIEWEPKLVTKAYRELTEEQRQLFDSVLIVKPASPTLKIVLPAKAAAAQAMKKAQEALAPTDTATENPQ
jgi:hypothetical protein